MEFKFDHNKNKQFLATKKIALIIGYFYQDIANNLLLATKNTLTTYGAKDKNIDIFYVPGAFEIPLIAKKIAKKQYYDGIITLGAVIQGETPHFDFVCNECSHGISNVSYEYEVPVSFGIITAKNMKQAIGRAGGYKGNKGEEAAIAMIEMIYLINEL
jgi:6,7-dimethyl-8-ribityllumazine synthase